MITRILIFSIFIFSNVLSAQEIIPIYELEEIENAHKLNSLLNVLPLSIVECLDSTGGDLENCACEGSFDCKSKSALFAARDHYCIVERLYPEWVNASPYYSLENDSRGFALHMPSMKTRLGKACN